MRRGTFVVLLVLLAVLVPMWYVAIQGEPPAEEVQIDHSVSEIRPLSGFVDTPTKLSPSQLGVIVWAALFLLLGVLAAAHRLMNEAVRPADPGEAAVADGGRPGLPWLSTGDRWVVEYHGASESMKGILVVGGLVALAIVFAALFTGEYLTLARTQYSGVYAAGMFLTLAALTVAYHAWFMPHVEVAERRDH